MSVTTWTVAGQADRIRVLHATEHRARAFDLFEAFLSASGARFMEIQSNDVLLACMLHSYLQSSRARAFVPIPISKQQRGRSARSQHS
jgi:hypothetical protein